MNAGGAVPALEVERLSFAYGKRPALRGVGFRVMPGEFAVLLSAMLVLGVPAMALQTLVENAVRHGAAPKVGTTHLRISPNHQYMPITSFMSKGLTYSFIQLRTRPPGSHKADNLK